MNWNNRKGIIHVNKYRFLHIVDDGLKFSAAFYFRFLSIVVFNVREMSSFFFSSTFNSWIHFAIGEWFNSMCLIEKIDFMISDHWMVHLTFFYICLSFPMQVTVIIDGYWLFYLMKK